MAGGWHAVASIAFSSIDFPTFNSDAEDSSSSWNTSKMMTRASSFVRLLRGRDTTTMTVAAAAVALEAPQRWPWQQRRWRRHDGWRPHERWRGGGAKLPMSSTTVGGADSWVWRRRPSQMGRATPMTISRMMPPLKFFPMALELTDTKIDPRGGH